MNRPWARYFTRAAALRSRPKGVRTVWLGDSGRNWEALGLQQQDIRSLQGADLIAGRCRFRDMIAPWDDGWDGETEYFLRVPFSVPFCEPPLLSCFLVYPGAAADAEGFGSLAATSVGLRSFVISHRTARRMSDGRPWFNWLATGTFAGIAPLLPRSGLAAVPATGTS